MVTPCGVHPVSAFCSSPEPRRRCWQCTEAHAAGRIVALDQQAEQQALAPSLTSTSSEVGLVQLHGRRRPPSPRRDERLLLPSAPP